MYESEIRSNYHEFMSLVETRERWDDWQQEQVHSQKATFACENAQFEPIPSLRKAIQRVVLSKELQCIKQVLEKENEVQLAAREIE